ncbi:MAG: recombinase family protein [bacterium]|nr:recombinase family protein [bacterium]
MAKRKSKMIQLETLENDARIIAGYARVSTDRQADEGYSIAIQTERIHSYIKATHGDNVRLEMYIDDGYSGGSIDRPAMNKLIHDVENNKVSKIVVVKLDRLSRSQKDTIHLMEDVFIAHNTGFISINESFDTSNAFGRAIVGILAVFAQLERENIFERTRSGMQKRVEEGYWMGGGRIPFGYDYDSTKGILVPNDEADTVRKIYDLYLKGYSCQHIARSLNLKYDRLVQQILLRKSNAGFIVYNGQEYQGKHEALIPLETYEAALRAYQERSAKARQITKTGHLLTGLVYCGVCGARMRYQKWGERQDRKLLCYSQQSSKPYLVKDKDCNNERLWASDVERIVINDLFAMTREALHDFSNEDILIRTLDLLQEQKKKAETKLSRLYQLFADGGDEVLLSTIDEVKKELETVNQKIADETSITSAVSATKKNYEQLADLESGWDEMTVYEQRNAICSVVESIIITGSNIQINYKI